MKKLIITCALLTSASIASFAQSNAAAQAASQNKPANANKPMNTEQLAQRRVKMDVAQFGLNADQEKKVYNVELEFTTAMEKYRSAGQQPGQGQMANLTTKRDEGMKAILTPEQYAKYEQTRPKQRPMSPNNANGNTPQQNH